MIKIFAWTMGGFFLSVFGGSGEPVSLPLVSWQSAPIFALPTAPDPAVATIAQNYLQRLQSRGLDLSRQGVSIETDWADLALHNPRIPASAASLTKIATTLAAVETWPIDHRFTTRFLSRGKINKGVLQGDLIIEAGGDPLLVWEEVIAIANKLNSLGIREVKGNLLVTGDLIVNFQEDVVKSGELVRVGMNSDRWSLEAKKAFQDMPKGTKEPGVKISGTVKLMEKVPEGTAVLLTHQSLTLGELLHIMNVYSNNVMAEMLAQSLGGAGKVAEIAVKSAGVSQSEISLINGSGLGVENRISPHAVCKMLGVLQEKLAAGPIKLHDLFPVAGRDKEGTMRWRAIPDGVMIKTGTLAQVSALAGLIPTRERGNVCFAITNFGSSNIEGLRHEQDEVLQALAAHWRLVPAVTKGSLPKKPFLGDPGRNLSDRS
ncbi:MAG: hypothetical protein N5P05_003915 [Chroococcopsis gigantea SAG 12.99]|jgi:D-alanyl-D-alanine carboxypeptidase/D-alanyl-D-alanine-endopeptidase (penicillin-binding protein 4)|nr:D-alanyl-D-alanine carboxypeptidase [Chlorogloea purpurea SAG 13.99]MDV3002309.1 hypothetical protein [Chroococcopsis gigantea SAG 12.99]